MITVEIAQLTDAFAEDKDAAARIREEKIAPALREGEKVVLDFSGVTLATQSFVHALISAPLRIHGESALEKIEFRKCVPGVRGIIETVVQYSLEGLQPVEDAEVAEVARGYGQRPKGSSRRRKK